MVACLCVGLSACGSSSPPPIKYRSQDFSRELPLILDANRIAIDTADAMDQADPDFPIAPRVALTSWVRERLHAGGRSNNVVRFIIFRANGMKRDVPYSADGKPISGHKTVQEYQVVLEATLELVGPDGKMIHAASTSVSDAKGVVPDAKPDDRQRACYDLVTEAISKLDHQMEAQIRDVFGPYLLSR